MRLSRIVSLILVVLVVTALPAVSGELAGVKMMKRISVDDQALLLNGMALRSKMMFKVYVAGLYLPEMQNDSEAILAADTTRHLAMRWLRNVGKEDICGGWNEGLAANTPDASASLKAQFETLCSFMEDAKKKELYSYTYLPGTGTRVTIAGQEKGVIEGKEFADALWASWIGPKPGPGQEFKDGLLGK